MFSRRNAFAPWKSDFGAAAHYFFGGALWLALGCNWTSLTPTLFSIGFTLVSVPLFYRGLALYEKGKKRKYGVCVEKNALEQFKKHAPPDWEFKEDLMMVRRGNIDLCVRLSNREMCTIEIKSRRRRTYHGRGIKAFIQALYQKKDMNAKHALVWLPQSPKNETHGRKYGKVIYVEGGAEFLVATLRKLDGARYTVRFPRAPRESIRSELKDKGFRWNKTKMCWEGTCDHESFPALSEKIKNAQGSIGPAVQ